MLDRQHLTILREIDRAGSVTAAADRMNISQSAISHAIAKLEARFGITLWRKKGRLLELTQGGKLPLTLRGGETRTFLQDGDEVVMRAYCEAPWRSRLGLGECVAQVLPAH